MIRVIRVIRVHVNLFVHVNLSHNANRPQFTRRIPRPLIRVHVNMFNLIKLSNAFLLPLFIATHFFNRINLHSHRYLDNQERSRFSRLLDKDTFRNAWLDILTIKKGSGFYDCWTKSKASAQCARELPAKVKQGFSFSKRILYSTSVYAPSRSLSSIAMFIDGT